MWKSAAIGLIALACYTFIVVALSLPVVGAFGGAIALILLAVAFGRAERERRSISHAIRERQRQDGG